MINVSRLQLRAARVLLELDQKDIEAAEVISRQGLSKIEKGEVKPKAETLNKLIGFFEGEGIEFLEDDGVRRRRSYIQRLTGTEGLRTFFDDVYKVAKEQGGEFIIFNGMPSELVKWAGEHWYEGHAKRMAEIKGNYTFRVIVEHGETNLIGKDFVTYKWFPEDEFHEHTIYTYGDRAAALSFRDEVQILVVRQKEWAESNRAWFQHVWEYAKDVPAHVHELQTGNP